MMVFNKRMILSKVHPLYFYLPLNRGKGEKPESKMTITVILRTRSVLYTYTGTNGADMDYPWWDEAELIDSETGEVICKNTKRNNRNDGFQIYFEDITPNPVGTKYTVRLIGVENHIKNGVMFNAHSSVDKYGNVLSTSYYFYQVELQTDTFDITVDKVYGHGSNMTVYSVDAYLKDLSCEIDTVYYTYYRVRSATKDNPHLSIDTDYLSAIQCSKYYKNGTDYTRGTPVEDPITGEPVLSGTYISKTFIDPYTNTSKTVSVQTWARIGQEYVIRFDDINRNTDNNRAKYPSKVANDYRRLSKTRISIRTDKNDPHLYSISGQSLSYIINEPIMYDIETMTFSEFTKEDTPIYSLYVQYKAIGYEKDYPYPEIDASGEIPSGTIYHKIIYNEDHDGLPWYLLYYSISLQDNNTYYPASVSFSQGGTLYYYTSARAITTGRFTYYHIEYDRGSKTVSTELEWVDEFAYKYSSVVDDVPTSESYLVADVSSRSDALVGRNKQDVCAVCSYFIAQTKGPLGPPDAWYNNHASLSTNWRFYDRRSDYEKTKDAYLNNENYVKVEEKKFFDIDASEIEMSPGVTLVGDIELNIITENRTIGSTGYNAILGFEYVMTEQNYVTDENAWINSLPELPPTPDIYNEFISP